MADRDKRKVKEVNGYKVNHPFGVGNIFFAFFTLVLIALPAGILILKLVTFSDEPELAITGLDLIKYGIMFLTQNTTDPVPEGIAYFVDNIVNVQDAFTPYRYALPDGGEITLFNFFFLGQAGCIAMMVLNSFFGLIILLVNLIKGYLRHSGLVKTLAVFDFLFALAFSLSYLVIFIFFVVAQLQTLITIWFALIPAGAFLVLLIIISSIRSGVYKDVIFEADLEYRETNPNSQPMAYSNEVIQQVNLHTITVPTYESANSLNPNIQTVGDHEYSQNQNLVFANIPEGITKLGAGAFSNCLRLKLVSIPVSVKEIGFNCFFNCVSLERINYAGTKAQWSKIIRGSNWLAKAKTSEVVCVDGAIVVNPYH